MVSETVEVVIVDGVTTFKRTVVELPLFERTGDLTETLGQYAGTINLNLQKKPAKTDS